METTSDYMHKEASSQERVLESVGTELFHQEDHQRTQGDTFLRNL